MRMVVMRKTRMISLNGLSIYVRLDDFPPFSSFVRIAIGIAHFEATMLPPVAGASDLERTTCPVASCITCHAFQGEDSAATGVPIWPPLLQEQRSQLPPSLSTLSVFYCFMRHSVWLA